MAKPLIDPRKFKAAAALARDLDDSLALTIGRFDKSRWPALTFPTFAVTGAVAAVSPDCSYRFLKKAIDAAQTSLLLYIYDASAPYLFDLLAAAKARGVKIKSMYDANSQGAAEKAALKAVSQTKAAPSSGDREVFTVCHQKFLVIDKKTVILESANWAKSSVPQVEVVGGFKKANREWFIRFDDAQVAGWFTKLFDADWKIPASAAASVAAGPVGPPDVAIAAAVQRPAKVFDFEDRADPAAQVTPIVSPDNYLTEVKALLQSAARSVYLQQQYVLAGDGVKDLVRVLAKKRADDPAFDVRIISSATFAQSWAGTKAMLDAAGMLDRLKAINPASFGHCHNKGVIVDGKVVVVSSTNWSANSLLRAREAGVLVRSEKIARYYEDVFLVDWDEGLTADDADAQLTVLEGADAL
jgi:phosphatidylserine/phosphatidylglycerophosphate/cardiolipin synthase-like enzyme